MDTQDPLLPPACAEDLGMCPLRTQRVIDVFQREIDRGVMPGAVVMLARHGRVALHQALGQLDPARGEPMMASSVFRIYSMTKPVASVAVMMLVEQGKLLLSDPIGKHLPEFKEQNFAVTLPLGMELRKAEPAATVHDLLRHTSGLTYEFMGEHPVQRQYAQAQMGRRSRTNAQFSQDLAALPLLHAPGTTWAYSRATDVLGRLIEVLSGQTLGQYLQENIFEPLGMVDTAFFVAPNNHHRIAEPFAHDPDGGIPMPVFNPRVPAALEAGGGGLMSTSQDYARFLQCLLNRGELDGIRLLGAHTVEYMTSDHLGAIPSGNDLLTPGHGFGLGFAVRTHAGVAATPGSLGSYHWSGIAGTTFFSDPNEDFFGILMTQAPNQRDTLRQLFRNLAYATLID